MVDDGSKYVLTQEGTLRINNAQIDDSGLYQCIATNRGGQSFKNFTVDVQCKLVVLQLMISGV